MKMFNKKIKLTDIDTGSLVWVEFGETKHIFLEKMKRDFKENCFEVPENYFSSLEDIVIAKLKAEVIQFQEPEKSETTTRDRALQTRLAQELQQPCSG